MDKDNAVPAPSASRDADDGADFETAISATGFGTFNLILIFVAIPSGWSTVFETTTISYMLPAAECDLNLTLRDKGLLNAVTYFGMISSGFIWGYLCDTLGRKKLLVIGLLLDGFFVIMSATSQNLQLLVIAKFFGGFIVNGPFAALITYSAEFHSAKHRARILMILGVIYSCGLIVLPLIAWAILPLDLSVNVKAFNNTLELHSWNLFLFLCATPTFIGALAFVFMPESPKFLMTTGRYEEALKVFRKVYSINSKQPAESYPINRLNVEVWKETKHGGAVTANRTTKQALKEGCQQITPIFFPPFLSKMILVCSMQFLFMMGVNTLRLWLPQIFQTIHDFPQNGKTSNLCNMMSSMVTNRNSTKNTTCQVDLSHNASVYINSIIVSVATLIGYVAAGLVINLIGKNILLITLSLIAGFDVMCLYFAQDLVTTTSLSSIFIAFGSIGNKVVLAVVVDLFPTTLRTMTVSITMMSGRIGPLIGNLIFPLLLTAGCAPPFIFFGTVMFLCAILSFLLPDTDQVPLV